MHLFKVKKKKNIEKLTPPWNNLATGYFSNYDPKHWPTFVSKHWPTFAISPKNTGLPLCQIRLDSIDMPLAFLVMWGPSNPDVPATSKVGKLLH